LGIFNFILYFNLPQVCHLIFSKKRNLKGKAENVDFNAEELKYRSIFVLLGWGIPIIHALIWININLRFQFDFFILKFQRGWPRSGSEYLISSLVSNTFHSLVYFTIEFGSSIIRILIFLQIKNVPIFDKNFQTKVRFILTKVLLYTLPFTITITFLIVSRTYGDLERIYKILTRTDFYMFCMSNVTLILRSFHAALNPLRGTMNGIVFFNSNLQTDLFCTLRLVTGNDQKIILL
jgi:hypothetical protein